MSKDWIEKIVTKTIFFRTVGLIGKCSVNSGELTLPDDDKPVAGFRLRSNENGQFVKI